MRLISGSRRVVASSCAEAGRAILLQVARTGQGDRRLRLFERFERLSAWLAWDCFGEMNGAPDFDSMIKRILRLRGDDESSIRAGDFQIGCVMISAPVFFGKSDWVSPPTDWAKTGIQQGM
jgi:hypothetical protein